MTARSLRSTATETQYPEAVIAHFIEEVQALILDRIVRPALDLRFDSLCHEMAGLLGCRVSEAVGILNSAGWEFYRTLKEVAAKDVRLRVAASIGDAV